MSIEWFESFASYAGVGASPGLLSKWSFTNIATFTTGPFGRRLRISGDNNQAKSWGWRDFAPKSSFSFGFDFRISQVPLANGFPVFAFYRRGSSGLNTATHGVLTFCLRNSGIIEVRLQANLLATGTGTKLAEFGPIKSDIDYFIEIEHVISADNAGRLKIILDTAVVVDLWDANTQFGANDKVDGFYLGSTDVAGYRTTDIGNVWIDTNPVSTGPKRVAVLAPNADVSSSGFTPSTGSTLYGCVDETPLATSDSITAGAVGDQVTLGFADATGLEDIYAVGLNTWINKTDAASREVQMSIRSGSASVATGAVNVPTTVNRIDLIAETDPATSGPWSLAAVNAITGRTEVVA